jgi:hypothetical protein
MPPRLDKTPRPKRQKPKPVTLDDTEARLLVADEKTYRAELWLDFARFARSHGGIVISRPSASPVTVLVPLGDGETSALEIALQSLPKYPVTKLPSLAARLNSHG